MPFAMSSAVVAFAALALVLPLVTACGSGPAEEGAAPQRPAATPGFVPDTKPAPPVRWVDATVPGGTPLKLALLQAVGTAESKAGDRFEARLTEAVVVGEMVAVPAGSILHGVVVESAPGGASPGGLATLTLLFERLSTPTGAGADMRARYRRRGPGDRAVLEKDATLTVMLESPLAIQVRQ
jgi:hypothetical protein